MTVTHVAKRIRADIVRLCRGGLDTETLRRQVVSRLQEAVPFDAWCWPTADPATLLITSSMGEGIPGEVALRFFEIEYGEPDVLKLTSLVHRRPPAGTLHEETGGDLRRSLRWREVFGPCGLGDELRLALLIDGRCWGYLSLHRKWGEPAFDPSEIAYVASLSEHLAHGLRTALLLGRVAPEDTDVAAPAVVLLDGQLAVQAVTPTAERWLASVAAGDSINDGRLPGAVYAVAAGLLATEPDGAETVPRARIRLGDGRWLTAHASRLTGRGGGQIAVVLEPAKPAELAPLVAQAYRLTPREREVARLVAQGLSTEQIAEALVVSPLTVQQHLKSAFEKVGVRSRRELVARIFSQQYWPRIEGGSRLDPDGWFAEDARAPF